MIYEQEKQTYEDRRGINKHNSLVDEDIKNIDISKELGEFV